MDDRECFNNDFVTRNMVDHIVAYCENNVDPTELEHCMNLINKDECYRNQTLESLEEAFEIVQDNPREENDR